ncbi:hypothetical protein [Clostridium ganghwense]|uniref:Uncharacterized protein n=1 Tax=Clostridium ganghwense TaxID=312089 RepID=A0ABT4CU36_9CLOT|nr:hypothetical protein [Clostridium ganghwense]MCY6372589.1 hypothetical protein [Clostridium ganghwense]
MEKGEYVQILDHSEWHGMIGIIDEVINSIPYVFCVHMPYYRYAITSKMRRYVKKIEFQ